MMNPKQIDHDQAACQAGAYRESLRGKTALEVAAWAIDEFGADVALASSVSPEDQVLTEMLCGVTANPRIFTLDTGRMFQETYDLLQTTMRAYGVRYDVFVPDAVELAKLLRRDGPNGMYESIDQRRACCELRKVLPLRQALAPLRAWVCGLRRDQGPTRGDTDVVAWDAEHGLYKVCPLFDWSEDAVWQYIRERNIPHSALHARGFRSIGCTPCTRAIFDTDDVRAGRWWWEHPEHRECGLHAHRQKRAVS